MTRKLTLELPDELSARLEAKAQTNNISLEKMAIASLEQLVEKSDDPIAALIGTLSADTDDIASRHDEYLGKAISQERSDEK